MFNKTFKTIAVASTLMVMTGLGEPVSVDAATFTGQTTANLNVRTGASTRYRVLGTLKKGTEVKVLSSSNGWYKVQYSGNKTGWSTSQYIKQAGSSESTDSSNSQNNNNAPAQGNGRTTANLNVRSGASTRNKVLTTLRRGTDVEILSSSNGWYNIRYSGNKTGWCSSQYISTSGGTETPSIPNPPATSNKTITVKSYAYTGGGTTATGTKARYGTLAVDPRVIPYGTKVYIKELNGVFIAEDCGGGIKGNKVDIYMNTKADCYNWGVRTITMEILN